MYLRHSISIENCSPDVCFLFTEHQIDKTTFELLDEAMIQELVPKIGNRLKFLKGWRAEVSCNSTFH